MSTALLWPMASVVIARLLMGVGILNVQALASGRCIQFGITTYERYCVHTVTDSVFLNLERRRKLYAVISSQSVLPRYIAGAGQDRP